MSGSLKGPIKNEGEGEEAMKPMIIDGRMECPVCSAVLPPFPKNFFLAKCKACGTEFDVDLPEDSIVILRHTPKPLRQPIVPQK